MSNRAVVFTGKNQLELRNIERPTPKAGQVMIRTRRTLISAGTECIALLRLFEEGTNWSGWVHYPFFPGYCGAGEAVAIEDDGDFGYKVGDRIVGWSGHQQFGISAANRAVRIPDGVSDEEAAWMPMGVIAQHGFRKADLALNETVIVVGLGMLGQLTVQFAAAAGAGKVIAIDPAQQRVDLALKHGATHGIASGVAEAAAQVKDITSGRGADVLYEITGHPTVFAATHALMADLGRIVLLGDCGTPSKQHLTSDFMGKNLTLIGAHQKQAAKAPVWNHHRMGEAFLDAVAAGRIDVKCLITHRFNVEDARAAFDVLVNRRDEAMGVVFEWPEGD